MTIRWSYVALAFFVSGCTSAVDYSPDSSRGTPPSTPSLSGATAPSGTASTKATPGTPLDTTGLMMEDIAADVGIYEINDSWSASPADYDADGDPDVLIGYHAQGAKLWQNTDGAFTRASSSAWAKRPDRHNCAWGDANHDSRLDVFCTVGRLKANNVKIDATDNELWLQQPDGSFIEVGTTWGIGDPYGRGRATTFINANGDEFPDLFVGNELPRETDADGGVGGENKLFLNKSGEAMQAAPEFGLHEFVGARCAHSFDYDEDGWQDLFVCGSKANHLYRNDAGSRFIDVTSNAGINSKPQKDVDFGDLDGDGDMDAILTSRTKVQYQLLADGVFASPQSIFTLTEGWSAALGDADGNGETDVYVVQSYGTSDEPDILLLNSGLAFAALEVPASTGSGDSVEALDSDGDGAVEFLVLNGSEPHQGPVQLLRLVSGTNAP